MRKKLLAIIATAAMVVAMIPAASFAASTMTSAQFIENADSTGKIVLNDDVTISDALTVNDGNYTIDLGGKKLTLTQPANYIKNNANVTFTNGTICIDSVYGGTYNDCIIGVGDYYSSATLSLNGVSLTGKNYNSSYAVIYVYNTSTLDVTDSTISLENDSSATGGAIKASNGKDGKINIINSELNLKKAQRGFINGTIEIKDSEVTMTEMDNGINGNPGQMDVTIDNTSLDVSDCTGRALTVVEGNTISVKNNSELNFSNNGEGDIKFKSKGTLEFDESSKLDMKTVDTTDVEGKNFKDLVTLPPTSELKVDNNGITIKCTHPGTKVINKKDATCAAEGYTGDTVCSACENLFDKGKTIPKLTEHTYKDGKCSVCGVADPNAPKAPAATDATAATGDDMNMALPITVAGLALAAMAVVMATRRRHS